MKTAYLLLTMLIPMSGFAEQNWIGPANNAFATDLYAKLAGSGQGNLFFSPNSIQTALAMTYAGARGDTATQMAAVLHLPAGNDKLQEDIGSFLKGLNGAAGEKRSYELAVANALWGQKGYAFLPDFLGVLKANYGAGLEEVDFKEHAEAARVTINTWVEKQTHDRIQDLIGPGVLTSQTRLVLTNAIYFKGQWEKPFDKKETRDEPFHLTADQQKNVSMMHRTGECGFWSEDDYQALKLNYAGNELSMIVLLPRKQDGLAHLESELPKIQFGREFAEEKVIVTLPKFKMTQGFELGPVLESMGMTAAFGDADFSGMTGKKDLAISDVIHKAFVEVNEEGTEAAAATAVGMKALAIYHPKPPAEFRADHPFLFVIRDEKSGAILFMGRVMDPG